jgi:hypothetical protein
MPKCINDKTKSYTGEEPSPKGLGYCAGNEEDGFTMKGKDGNMWIVKSTKNCKKWFKNNDSKKSDTSSVGSYVELSVGLSVGSCDTSSDKSSKKSTKKSKDNAPESIYIPAYYPVASKLISGTKETGLEEKFGGNVPFFIKGESWPIFENVPMTFFGQIKDPRKNDNMLYRIFIPIDNDIYLEDYIITKIELNKKNLKLQIKIDKPVCSNVEQKITNFPAQIIHKWDKKNELKSFEFLSNELNIKIDGRSNLYNELSDLLSNHKLAPIYGIKVGGMPCFTQCAEDKTIKKYNFLQISGTSILPYDWGDAGIAHISEDCELYWDCC